MGVGELFYQSAIISSFIFLWIASAMSSGRILLRLEKKIGKSVLLSVLLGPLAFLGAWLYEAYYNQAKNKKAKISVKSHVAIILSALIAIFCSHQIIVLDFFGLNLSSEKLIVLIELVLVVLGLFSGLFTAAITKRIGFFESCWTVFFVVLYFATIDQWASESFSYGTSLIYFTTLILSGGFSFLIFSSLGASLGYLGFGDGRLNLNCGYESFIGLRFLMTKRSSQVVSLITLISIFAVTIACAGMIVVMSVMNGFSSDLRAKILGANPHLMILKYGKDFFEYEEIVAKTKNLPGIISASPFIVNEGMIAKGKNIASSLITGIANYESHEDQLLKYISKESLESLNNPEKIPVVQEIGSLQNIDDALDKEVAVNDLPGVIIGKEMAHDLQVFVGERVNIISPVGELGPTGPIPKAKAFRVAGLFDSGMYEYDAKFAYIRLNDAQEFFNLGNNVTGIEYRLEDIDKTKEVAQNIDVVIGGYPFYSRDWMQMNRNMFSALQLEKIAMLIILGTMIFMASLLILVTLIMVVMEKGKEIAILKSMGATDSSIMKIFVSYGLVVGGLGAFLGGFLGLSLCFLIDKIGIRLDSDVYYFNKVPIKIESIEVFLVVLVAIIISYLATVPPSLFAARLKPVEGLRYE